MGKYLKKFTTKEEYEKFVNSPDYKTPNVSVFTNKTGIVYKKYIPSDFYFDFNNDYDIS